MKIYKKLAGQTLVYGLGTVVPRLLNYTVLTAYYTRLFKVEQFGLITELYAYVTFLLVILTFGTETGFFKFASDKSSKAVFSTISVFLFFTSLFFGVLVLLFSGNIADWLKYEGHKEYISMMGGIIAIDAFSTIGFAKLRLEERSLKFSILKIINVVVTILLVVIFYEIIPWWTEDPSNEENISYVLVSNLIASATILILLIPEYFRTSLSFNFPLLKSILYYSFPLVISGLAGFVNETLDKVLLRHLITDGSGAYALGIYGANYRIAMLLFIVIQMVRFALEPFYFNYYEKPDAKKIFAQIMRLFVVGTIIVIMVILFYLDIIKYFIDAKFHEGLGVVPIILSAYVLYGIFFNLSIWYKLTKKTIFAIVLTGIGAAITIIINLLFVPRYSYMASAWAHFVSYTFMVLLSYFVGRKFYPIDYKIIRIIEYVTVGLAIFAIHFIIPDSYVVFNYFLSGLLILGYAIYVAYRENLLVQLLKRL